MAMTGLALPVRTQIYRFRQARNTRDSKDRRRRGDDGETGR